MATQENQFDAAILTPLREGLIDPPRLKRNFQCRAGALMTTLLMALQLSIGWAETATSPYHWLRKIDGVLQTAQASNKGVVVYVVGKNAYDEQIASDVFASIVGDKFIPVILDAKKDSELIPRLGISSAATAVIYDSKGSAIGKVENVTADKLLASLAQTPGGTGLPTSYSTFRPKPVRQFACNATSAAFFPDGNRIAALDESSRILILDIASSSSMILPIVAGEKTPSRVAVSRDGGEIAALSEQKDGSTVMFWDVKGNKAKPPVPLGTTGVRLIKYTDKGCLAVSVQEAKDITKQENRSGACVLWDAHTGKLLKTFTAASMSPVRVALSNDGTMLAAAGYGRPIELWDCATGAEKQLLRPEGTDSAQCVDFSIDGRRLLSGGDDAVRLWDTSSGQQVSEMPGGGYIDLAITFHPNGRHLFVGGLNKSFFLQDSAVYRKLLEMRQSCKVVSILVSPDGKSVAARQEDRKWDQSAKQWTLGPEHGIVSVWSLADAR